MVGWGGGGGGGKVDLLFAGLLRPFVGDFLRGLWSGPSALVGRLWLCTCLYLLRRMFFSCRRRRWRRRGFLLCPQGLILRRRRLGFCPDELGFIRDSSGMLSCAEIEMRGDCFESEGMKVT